MATSQKPTFMTLPAEVRCLIYGYLLEEAKPIAITLTKSGILARRSLTSSTTSRKGNRNRIYNDSTGQWTPAIPVKSAIISINHQIFDEASTTLYGNNRFVFRMTSDIPKTLSVLGKRVQLIRDIQIESEGFYQRSAMRAFDALIPAKGLSTISVDHGDVCDSKAQSKRRITLIQIVEASKKLFQGLHSSHQELNLNKTVLDVIKMSTDKGCFKCSFHGPRKDCSETRYCGCKCSEAVHNSDRLQRELRFLIAVELKIDDPKAPDGGYTDQ